MRLDTFFAKDRGDAACGASFDFHKISCYKQHRTRPCKERKSGAPTFWVVSANSKAGPPAIKGSVDPSNSGKDKLIDIEVKVDIGLKGKSLQETIAHEGSHVGDDINFLTSYNFATGHYDPAANITHGQTEFNAFQTGAGVTHEHGFGPNDVNKINQFLQNSPTYGPILNVPVFNPNDPDYPQ